MNIKNISIALSVLVIAVAALLLMQKGNYVTQATEHYNKTTKKTFNGSSKIIDYVNTTATTARMLWALSADAIQNAKTSQDMAKLEAKYFPQIKGSNSISQKTRRFEATSYYYIVSSFDKVDVDKKAGGLKTLSKLKSIDINPLLGNATIEAPSEEDDDEIEE